MTLELVAASFGEGSAVSDISAHALHRGTLTLGMGENDVSTDATHLHLPCLEPRYLDIATHAADLGILAGSGPLDGHIARDARGHQKVLRLGHRDVAAYGFRLDLPADFLDIDIPGHGLRGHRRAGGNGDCEIHRHMLVLLALRVLGLDPHTISGLAHLDAHERGVAMTVLLGLDANLCTRSALDLDITRQVADVE